MALFKINSANVKIDDYKTMSKISYHTNHSTMNYSQMSNDTQEKHKHHYMRKELSPWASFPDYFCKLKRGFSFRDGLLLEIKLTGPFRDYFCKLKRGFSFWDGLLLEIKLTGPFRDCFCKLERGFSFWDGLLLEIRLTGPFRDYFCKLKRGSSFWDGLLLESKGELRVKLNFQA